ncbi:chromate transporter [Vibrio sp. 99-70-13A1]|uniref:chromate transporter n=1 Tax=Vibrio sp. 99-70-13A1 TaxID=2607601 RepID=UPI001493392E|nr:chromate transporter [Vibrio sp. 99-70-13A1]NOH97555.1 chromate transporter [Vibrio sp. 99-70-13A1]
MQLYIDIFLAFFIPNIVGYGGGPAIIPLIEAQVVGQYNWMDATGFAEVLALGNALPSPIATKMAGYIGYEVGGVWGAFLAVFATAAPTILIMIIAMSILYKYRNAPKVKALSAWVLPVIAALMAILTYKLVVSGMDAGITHFVLLFIFAAVTLEKLKIHPTWVISSGLVYGALFLGS